MIPTKSGQTKTTSKPSVFSKRSSHRPNDEIIDTFITIPPDGGWGWVIVLAAFFSNMIVDGCNYSFGLFLDTISEDFKVPQTSIAVANSLMTGFYYLLGPVVCAVVNRYGFRAVGFCGGFLASIALFCSSVVYSRHLFLLILGPLGGLGFGMVYVPSTVIIGFYFEKWRSLATSIASSGTAAGVICFPLLVHHVFHNLTWRFQFRIIGAACICVALLALTYIPLKPVRVLQDGAKVIEDLDSSSDDSSKEAELGFFSKIFRRFHNTKFPTASEAVQKKSTAVLNLSTSDSSASSIFISSVPNLPPTGDSLSTILKSTASKYDNKSDRLSTVYEANSWCDVGRCRKFLRRLRYCCRSSCCIRRNYINRPMYRDDIFYSASLVRVPIYPKTASAVTGPSTTSAAAARTQTLEYHMSVSRVATQKDIEEEYRCCKCCPMAVKRTLATMLDFNLLKSSPFLLFATSGAIILLGVYPPYMYIIARAVQFGIKEQSANFLLSALGISNFIGRIASGVIASIPHVDPLVISYSSTFICGIATILSTFLKSESGQYVYVCVFGLTIACVGSLRAPIIVDLLGLEKLTNAFGIMMLLQGIAGFIGGPMAGVIIDYTGSYNSGFIFSGTCITLSSVLLMPIQGLVKKQKFRTKQAKTNKSRSGR